MNGMAVIVHFKMYLKLIIIMSQGSISKTLKIVKFKRRNLLYVKSDGNVGNLHCDLRMDPKTHFQLNLSVF